MTCLSGPIDASRGTGAHLQVCVTPGPPSSQQSLLPLLIFFFFNSFIELLICIPYNPPIVRI